MKSSNINFRIAFLLIPLFLASCDYEDLEEIESPSIKNWSEAPVFADGSVVISIQDGIIQMGQEVGGLSEFSKNFQVTNLIGYSKAILTINFTEVQMLIQVGDPIYAPLIYINGVRLGSVLQNSTTPNSTSCWEDIGGGHKYYKCEFVSTVDIKTYLIEGNNVFRISNSNDNQIYLLGKAIVELKN